MVEADRGIVRGHTSFVGHVCDRTLVQLHGLHDVGILGLEAREDLLALLGAFILSLTLVPVLASYLLKGSRASADTWLMQRARHGYAPLLRRVLKRP